MRVVKINIEERSAALKRLRLAKNEADYWQLLYPPDGFVRLSTGEQLAQHATEKSVTPAAMMLNDNFDPVIEVGANILAKIGSEQCLHILGTALKNTQLERPTFVANALAQFGEQGFLVLLDCLKSQNANVRYYAARGIGSTNNSRALKILKEIAESDHEKTSFGGLVSTAAKKGIKTLERLQRHTDKGR